MRLGYLGSRTHRLFSVWTLNRARDVPGIPFTTRTINQRRPDGRYFDVDRVLNGSRAYYDAPKASLIARRWHGLSMDLSYWFSKAIDLGTHYASNGSFRDGSPGLSQTEFDVHGDVKGLSEFDQPHAALWRFTYQTPRLGGSKPWLQKTFGQWELFSVVLLKAGTPFAVRSGSDGPGFGNVDGAFSDRPHVVDPSVLGNSADHPDTAPLQVPKSAFAFIRPGEPAGNLGRNTFRKDGIRNVNFAVSRDWKISSEKTLTFRAESINFFNTAQLLERSPDLSGRQGLGVLAHAVFGRIHKQAGAVAVDGQRTAVFLHIRPQQTAVLFAPVVPHKARQQLAAGIVDHADQIQLLVAASLQPVVLGGVPLHQLAAATAPRPPQVRPSSLAPVGLPQPGRARRGSRPGRLRGAAWPAAAGSAVR